MFLHVHIKITTKMLTIYVSSDEACTMDLPVKVNQFWQTAGYPTHHPVSVYGLFSVVHLVYPSILTLISPDFPEVH